MTRWPLLAGLVLIVGVTASIALASSTTDAVRRLALTERLAEDQRDSAVAQIVSVAEREGLLIDGDELRIELVTPTDRSYVELRTRAGDRNESEAVADRIAETLVRLMNEGRQAELVATQQSTEGALGEAEARLVELEATVASAIVAEAESTARIFTEPDTDRELIDREIYARFQRYRASVDERNALRAEVSELERTAWTTRLDASSALPLFDVVPVENPAIDRSEQALRFAIASLALLGVLAIAAVPDRRTADVVA